MVNFLAPVATSWFSLKYMKISEVAEVAGCTVRTIYHYHRIGILPEPERLSNGYRNYSVEDLTEVLRIRALAEAGVPLANVHDPDAASTATGLLDDKIKQLRHQQKMLNSLASGSPGAPADIRSELTSVMGMGSMLEMELTMLDLMALCGVATDETWTAIRDNLDDPEVITHSRRAAEIWEELGDLPSYSEEAQSLMGPLGEAMSRGYMRGVIKTLNEGSVPISMDDLRVSGAQEMIIHALVEQMRRGGF